MANEDKATRYHRLRRRAVVAGGCAAALVLILLLITGGAAALGRAVDGVTGGSFALSVALYMVVVSLLVECAQAPFAHYQGVTLERRYGLSTQTAWRWWLDRARGSGVGLVMAVGAALIVYVLLRGMPDGWWIAGAVIFTILLVLLAHLAPVLLLPIFYRFSPLDRGPLVERLVALARRANAQVLGVFEWRLSDRTRRANAALTGLGRTRRILLSDTLLADHSDDEIEVIVAHELAHHVHHDLWRALALDAVLITAGFYAAHQALIAAGPWLRLESLADPAGLPLLVLTAGAVSLLLAPAANLLSRLHERRADRYALDLTRNAEAFVTAMRKLAATNLAEDRPSRVVEWLWHSHPATSARIAAARRWSQEDC